MRHPFLSIVRNVAVPAAIALLLAVPVTSLADIYRWVDDGGVIHFTDDPSSIPEKYRRKVEDIQKLPPAAGKPSLSTIGAPPSPAGSFPATGSTFQGDGAPSDSLSPSIESQAAEAEQLRAKIAAKEQFIDTIDRKRSNILTPLGNRYVDPADLDLYAKYKEELPADRARLKELESRLSPGVN